MGVQYAMMLEIDFLRILNTYVMLVKRNLAVLEIIKMFTQVVHLTLIKPSDVMMHKSSSLSHFFIKAYISISLLEMDSTQNFEI